MANRSDVELPVGSLPVSKFSIHGKVLVYLPVAAQSCSIVLTYETGTFATMLGSSRTQLHY
jgi:hypothetical protein